MTSLLFDGASAADGQLMKVLSSGEMLKTFKVLAKRVEGQECEQFLCRCDGAYLHHSPKGTFVNVFFYCVVQSLQVVITERSCQGSNLDIE